MDLKTYKYPVLNDVDMEFSILDTDKILLEEAKTMGFASGHHLYNRIFNKLFFCQGGKLLFKENLTDNQLNSWKYCIALMKSFAQKHEHKEVVCSMLMSEVLDEKTLELE